MSTSSASQSQTIYFDGHGQLATEVCSSFESRAVKCVAFAGDLSPWFSVKDGGASDQVNSAIIFLPSHDRSSASPIERAIEFHQLVSWAPIVVWWPVEPNELVLKLWPWAILVGSPPETSNTESAQWLVDATLRACERHKVVKRRRTDKTSIFVLNDRFGGRKVSEEAGRAA